MNTIKILFFVLVIIFIILIININRNIPESFRLNIQLKEDPKKSHIIKFNMENPINLEQGSIKETYNKYFLTLIRQAPYRQIESRLAGARVAAHEHADKEVYAWPIPQLTGTASPRLVDWSRLPFPSLTQEMKGIVLDPKNHTKIIKGRNSAPWPPTLKGKPGKKLILWTSLQPATGRKHPEWYSQVYDIEEIYKKINNLISHTFLTALKTFLDSIILISNKLSPVIDNKIFDSNDSTLYNIYKIIKNQMPLYKNLTHSQKKIKQKIKTHLDTIQKNHVFYDNIDIKIMRYEHGLPRFKDNIIDFIYDKKPTFKDSYHAHLFLKKYEKIYNKGSDTQFKKWRGGGGDNPRSAQDAGYYRELPNYMSFYKFYEKMVTHRKDIERLIKKNIYGHILANNKNIEITQVCDGSVRSRCKPVTAPRTQSIYNINTIKSIPFVLLRPKNNLSIRYSDVNLSGPFMIEADVTMGWSEKYNGVTTVLYGPLFNALAPVKKTIVLHYLEISVHRMAGDMRQHRVNVYYGPEGSATWRPVMGEYKSIEAVAYVAKKWHGGGWVLAYPDEPPRQHIKVKMSKDYKLTLTIHPKTRSKDKVRSGREVNLVRSDTTIPNPGKIPITIGRNTGDNLSIYAEGRWREKKEPELTGTIIHSIKITKL
jgi:hypothetical protein